MVKKTAFSNYLVELNTQKEEKDIHHFSMEFPVIEITSYNIAM